MSNRFVIEETRSGDMCHYVLVDTSRDPHVEVFHDLMEPEDASLTRDLEPLVALLNVLAAEVEELKNEVYALR